MTIKDKMKTYNFWISLVSALLLVARILGAKFNFTIDSSLVMDVTTGMCGVFVVLGIISVPQKTAKIPIENASIISPIINALKANEGVNLAENIIPRQIDELEVEEKPAENNTNEQSIEIGEIEVCNEVVIENNATNEVAEEKEEESCKDVQIEASIDYNTYSKDDLISRLKELEEKYK